MIANLALNATPIYWGFINENVKENNLNIKSLM